LPAAQLKRYDKNTMLREEEILLELKHYQKFQEYYNEGKRGSDLPKLPGNRDDQKNNSYMLFGLMIHPLLFASIIISRILRLHKFVAFFSKVRIATDKLSHEPVSCGFNQAYTNLGLALLVENDIQGAIHCLDLSWRVHPCPHNTSFGLDRRLVSKLRHFPEAEKNVEKYIKMGKQFVYWPEGWVYRILGHNKSLESDA
jgi:hypothetical protein